MSRMMRSRAMPSRAARFSCRQEPGRLLIFKLPNNSSRLGAGGVFECFECLAMEKLYDRGFWKTIQIWTIPLALSAGDFRISNARSQSRGFARDVPRRIL